MAFAHASITPHFRSVLRSLGSAVIRLSTTFEPTSSRAALLADLDFVETSLKRAMAELAEVRKALDD